MDKVHKHIRLILIYHRYKPTEVIHVTKHQVMKTCWGSGRIPSRILKFGAPVPISKEGGWAPELVEKRWRI